MNILKLFEKSILKYNFKKAINELKKEKWITVKGNHILLKEGQTPYDALKEFLNSNSKQEINKKEIPKDINGNSLKLKRIQKPSVNMKIQLEKGYYPIGAIVPSSLLSKKEQKKIDEILANNYPVKTNFKINYLYKNQHDNSYIWSVKENKMIPSNPPLYFDSIEKLNSYKEKFKDTIDFISEPEEVKEWHHYYGGSKSYMVDIKKLEKMGFNIDFSTAHSSFKK